MYAMSMTAKVRAWVWRMMSLDLLPTAAMLNALEQREQDRHKAMMGMLNRVEQRMINEHIGAQPRGFSVPVLDWDTVQTIAMQSLIENPPKEEN